MVRIAALALLSLLLSPAAFALAPPPPLPEDQSVEALLAALPEEDRRALLAGERLVSFAESRTERDEGVTYRTLSLGALRHSPQAVQGLFTATTAYPTWMTLSPTYKAVRVVGGREMICEVGRVSSPRPRETLTYDIGFEGGTPAWTLTTIGKALAPGSSLSFELLPLRDHADRSLLVHRQTGRLKSEGRKARSLDSADEEGRKRYWTEADEHARRLHWAIDAALSHPPGEEREQFYLDRYAAEFQGSIPYWAK